MVWKTTWIQRRCLVGVMVWCHENETYCGDTVILWHCMVQNSMDMPILLSICFIIVVLYFRDGGT